MSDFNSELFTQALGLPAPWKVLSVTLDQDKKRVDFEVGFVKGSRFTCPDCEAIEQPVHDTRKRSWRHLNFFQFKAFIHASVPRVKCQHDGKVHQVAVPWAKAGSGYTLMFEAMVLAFAKDMPVNKVAEHFHVGDDPLWRILTRHVDKARTQEDHSAVRAVGIDETSRRKGHNYITVFCDLDTGKVLYVTKGKDHTTVERFAEDLKAHGGDPDKVDIASIDMSKAFKAGATKSLPNAEITYDPFHVIALGSKAVDEVRREEVKVEVTLKGQRWLFLHASEKLTDKQLSTLTFLQRTSPKTIRAWDLKETLRTIYRTAVNKFDAETQFNSWYSWARRSRLEPFKKLALTIKEHLDGILTHFDERYSNGMAEGINSRLQAAKARARGFRRTENFITMAYLIAGKLKHLPHSPFATTSSVN